jgi:transcriptional regulator with XRE-family HTH domain
MDLQALGRALEDRRKTFALARGELARHLGVSTNYIWMVERAKPRAHGEPSQPSRNLLERWVQFLWEAEHDQIEMTRILALAGYTAEYVPAEALHRRVTDGSPPSAADQPSREHLIQKLLHSLEASAEHIARADERLTEAQALVSQLLAADQSE